MPLSSLSAGLNGKPLRCAQALANIGRSIPWDKLCEVIAPYYPTGEGGRPSKPLLLMLKIHCLQQWYGLSDPAMEDAIYDRNSFQQFLEIDLLGQGVPDETTLLNFRHLLERHHLGKALFDKINAYLSEQALLLKRGTIVDASIIHAPNSSKKTRERHAEMSRTRKGSQVYFGMKMHIGVDAESGLVHSVACTKASVNDIERVDALCHGEERAVFGDKGYAKQALKKRLRAAGQFYGILDKAERYSKLSPSQIKRNRSLSSIRAKVEHPFRIVKHLWGYRKIRYRGLFKNANQVYLLFGLSNLYMSRKQLGVTMAG
jgi:IS5 family transposase